MSDDVIDFAERKALREKSIDDLTFTRIKNKRCVHAAFDVDASARTVECRACKTVLDPIDVFLTIAENESRMREVNRRHKWCQEELNSYRAKLNELRAEEKRIKSRIRTAKAREQRGPDGAGMEA